MVDMATLDSHAINGNGPMSSACMDPSSQDSYISDLVKTVRDNLPDNGGSSYNREKLLNASRKLSVALETPGDTIQRIAYLPLQATVCRIAVRLNLFNILQKSKKPKSCKELAETTGVDHTLLIRLLRYLASIDAIRETDEDRYAANNVSINLTMPSLAAGLCHNYETLGPCFFALPEFLEKNKYQNPIDGYNCPFQVGFHTKENSFQWFPKNPENLDWFNSWMTGQRDGRPYWLDFFPFEQQIVHGFRERDDAVMLVDVGGGRGHEIEAIKARYPKLPGRMILQDLPDTVKQALPVEGMTTIVHDFFAPQPVQGARVYYMRNIMHDWLDDKCQVILKHIASAMTKGYSKVLLNEMVLPNRGASMIATQVDRTMLSALGAMERTEAQWRELLGSSGLEIEKIWSVSQDIECIIEVVLK